MWRWTTLKPFLSLQSQIASVQTLLSINNDVILEVPFSCVVGALRWLWAEIWVPKGSRRQYQCRGQYHVSDIGYFPPCKRIVQFRKCQVKKEYRKEGLLGARPQQAFIDMPIYSCCPWNRYCLHLCYIAIKEKTVAYNEIKEAALTPFLCVHAS